MHNYLCLIDNPSGIVDSQSGSGEIRPCDWRNLVTETNGAATIVKNIRGCRDREDAVEMRDPIMSYVNVVGKVEWQVAHVRRT